VTPKTRETLASFGLLVLRVGAGVPLLWAHGWGKITEFSDRASRFSDPLHVGSPASLALVVLAEVFCSIAVILGLFTRIAVVPWIIFFAVALFIQHADDPFPRKELALLYGVIAIALLFLGGGRFALEGWLRRKLGGGKG
jgi:putative oxidoreductase